jgi:hypothetical protein
MIRVRFERTANLSHDVRNPLQDKTQYAPCAIVLIRQTSEMALLIFHWGHYHLNQ